MAVSMSPIRVIRNSAIEQVRQDARLATRKRLHLNVHISYEDNPQILYNCMFRGSYLRPHRHLPDGRQEFFVCLEGQVLLVTFTEAGVVNAVIHMGTGNLSLVSSVMVEPSAWHTLVCVSDHAILLEVKPGPFHPHLAKEFAPWSPDEGDPSGMAYLEQAIALF